MRTLIIEDEPQLARHIKAALVRHGHSAEVKNDGGAGLQEALNHPPDLIVLDINLPTMDGFQILSQVRKTTPATRVLMLTARGEKEDRLRGLKGGADDYLTKPFDMDELIARVEALGRRGTPTSEVGSLQIADLHMNVQQRRVTRGGQVVSLSPREFDVLQLLLQEPGRIFSRTEIFDRVWQREHTYDSRTVEMFIARLRRKVDDGFPTPLIHTLRLVGYTVSDQPQNSNA
ncbi:MAG: response regulator transcription factor [Nibricoccus sp.]